MLKKYRFGRCTLRWAGLREGKRAELWGPSVRRWRCFLLSLPLFPGPQFQSPIGRCMSVRTVVISLTVLISQVPYLRSRD